MSELLALHAEIDGYIDRLDREIDEYEAVATQRMRNHYDHSPAILVIEKGERN